MNTNYFILLILSLAGLFNTLTQPEKDTQRAMIATAYGIGVDPGVVPVPMVNLVTYDAQGNITSTQSNVPLNSLTAAMFSGASNVVTLVTSGLIISSALGVNHSADIVSLPGNQATYIFYVSSTVQRTNVISLS